MVPPKYSGNFNPLKIYYLFILQPIKIQRQQLQSQRYRILTPPKKIDPKKQPGLAKLKKKRPDVVAKMGFFKKGGKA